MLAHRSTLSKGWGRLPQEADVLKEVCQLALPSLSNKVLVQLLVGFPQLVVIEELPALIVVMLSCLASFLSGI